MTDPPSNQDPETTLDTVIETTASPGSVTNASESLVPVNVKPSNQDQNVSSDLVTESPTSPESRNAKSMEGFDDFPEITPGEQGFKDSGAPIDSNSSPATVLSGAVNSPKRNVSPLSLESLVTDLARKGDHHSEPAVEYTKENSDGDAQRPTQGTLSSETKLKLELEGLKKNHQQEIEEMKRSFAAELTKAEGNKRALVKRSLSDKDEIPSSKRDSLKAKNELLAQINSLIAGKDSTAEEAFSVVRDMLTHYQELPEGIKCKEQMHELNVQLQKISDRDQESRQLLKTARRQIVEDKEDISILESEMRAQEIVLQERNEILRADDTNAALLDKMVASEDETTSRIKEVQTLYFMKRQFNLEHQSMKNKAVLDMTSLVQDLHKLQDKLDNQDVQLRGLEVENAVLEDETAKLSDEKANLEQEYTRLNTQWEIQNTLRISLEKQVTTLKDQVKTLEADLSREIADNDRQRKDELDRMDIIKGDLEDGNTWLKDKMRTLFKSRANLKEIIALLKATVKDLKSSRGGLEGEITTLQDQVRTLKADLDGEIEKNQRYANRTMSDSSAQTSSSDSVSGPTTIDTDGASPKLGTQTSSSTSWAESVTIGTDCVSATGATNGLNAEDHLPVNTDGEVRTFSAFTHFSGTDNQPTTPFTLGSTPQVSIDLNFGGASDAGAVAFTAGRSSPEVSPQAQPKEHGGLGNEKKEEDRHSAGIDAVGQLPSNAQNVSEDLETEGAEGSLSANNTTSREILGSPPKPRKTKTERREAAMKAQDEAKKVENKEAPKLSKKEKRAKMKALLKESKN